MRRHRHPRCRPARPADHDPRGGQIPPTLLGLDIGGSSSRSRLRANGRGVVDADGPGANVAVLEARLIDDRLSALLSRLGSIHPDACCAGAAGAEVPGGRTRLHDLLEGMLPGCRLSVVHDARLVLAAAGVDAGIAVIAGTGSVAYGRTANGHETQRGGWGWMIGDDGGGAWITREASREVIGRAESGRSVGPLGEAILAACGARDSHEPMQWAAVASAVFAGSAVDPASRDVIHRAAAALAQLVSQVQDALGLEGPVVLAGGLLLNQPLVQVEVRERTGAQCIRLEEPPVEGAVRLAEELARQ